MPFLRHGLGALLILLVATPLLSYHAYRPWDRPGFHKLVTHRFLADFERNIHHAPNYTSALTFSDGYKAFTVTNSVSTWPRIKRGLDRKWNTLVCKGKEYVEKAIPDAFDGRSLYPAPESPGEGEEGFQDLGWLRSTETVEFPSRWRDAFEMTEYKMGDGEVHKPGFDQDFEFENGHGKRVIAKAIPRLHRLSDVLWYEWKDLADHPESLRYYAVEDVENAVTSDLMDEICKAYRKTSDVPWAQRLTFDMDSEEGQALLASPNGIAVNWLLIHNAAVLKKRELRVTIFNPLGRLRCMIWDMIPEGHKGSFGDPIKQDKMTGNYDKMDTGS
ncbi:MAG: hypothetical protein Q9166_000663 [cf. Caloplaca sp. 2 TL-2023]